MRASAAVLFLLCGACIPSESAGVWRADADALPMSAAGWTGGLEKPNHLYAYQELTYYGGSNRLFTYSLLTDHWDELAPNPASYFDAGSAVLDGVVYECGPDLTSTQLSCASYDGISGAWADLPPNPNYVLDLPGVIGFDHLLYIAGRRVNQQANPVIATFDPSTGAWATVGQSSLARTTPVMVELDGVIYLMGSADTVPETEQFVPGGGPFVQATIAGTVPSELVHIHSAVAAGHRIFVVADTPAGTSSLWSWEPAGDHWSRVDSVPRPRSGASIVSDGEHLFILGGFTNAGTSPTNAVDIYYLP